MIRVNEPKEVYLIKETAAEYGIFFNYDYDSGYYALHFPGDYYIVTNSIAKIKKEIRDYIRTFYPDDIYNFD